MKNLRKFTIVAFLILSIFSCASAEVGDLLKAHFTAVGGLDRLSEIQTLRRSGDVQLTGTFGEMIGTVEETAIIGKKSYQAIRLFGEIAEVTVWDGKKGWKKAETTPTIELSGDELEIAKSAAFIDPLQPYYEEYGSDAFRLSEEETFNDKACKVLKITGTQVLYYIDKTSHLLVGMKAPFTPLGSEETTVTIHYEDYVEHAGVMFPSVLKVIFGEGTGEDDYTYTCTYTETEVDATVDKKRFEKPK